MGKRRNPHTTKIPLSCRVAFGMCSCIPAIKFVCGYFGIPQAYHVCVCLNVEGRHLGASRKSLPEPSFRENHMLDIGNRPCKGQHLFLEWLGPLPDRRLALVWPSVWLFGLPCFGLLMDLAYGAVFGSRGISRRRFCQERPSNLRAPSLWRLAA